METFKEACRKAVIEVDHKNYCMDDLEVFIDRKI